MRLFGLLVLVVLFLQMSIMANAETFYIESWKKGKTQIEEKTLNLTLDDKISSYSEVIYDSFGKEKYRLFVTAGKGSKGIIEWMAQLEELSNKSDEDLLKPSNDKKQDYYTWQDFFGWFYKGSKEQFAENNQFKDRNAVLPFLSKRIVKVENFYCLLQITDYKQNKDEEVVLDSVILQVQFSNNCDLSQCVSKEKK